MLTAHLANYLTAPGGNCPVALVVGGLTESVQTTTFHLQTRGGVLSGMAIEK